MLNERIVQCSAVLSTTQLSRQQLPLESKDEMITFVIISVPPYTRRPKTWTDHHPLLPTDLRCHRLAERTQLFPCQRHCAFASAKTTRFFSVSPTFFVPGLALDLTRSPVMVMVAGLFFVHRLAGQTVSPFLSNAQRTPQH